MGTLFVTAVTPNFSFTDLIISSRAPRLVLKSHQPGHVHMYIIFWVSTFTNKITSYQYN